MPDLQTDHSNYGADAHRRYEADTIWNIMIEMRSLVTKLQYDDPNESGYWDPKNNIFNNVSK